MYDRKTWIILILCGGLLIANLYFSAGAQREKAAQERAIAEQNAAQNPLGLDPNSATTAGLTVETPPPPTSEKIVTLENDEVTFTLSSIGGGIKFTEFKHQKNIGEDSLVRINRNGGAPIGGIVGATGVPENISYTYRADQSIPNKTAVFIAKLPSGLIAKKKYSLLKDDIPGAAYFLDLDLTLENSEASPLNLADYGLYLGEASPLYAKERPNHTGFFWMENGEMHFKAATKFKGGWFSDAQSVMSNPAGETLSYAGVTDQFFTTVIRPLEPYAATITGKPISVTLGQDAKQLTAVRGSLSLPDKTLVQSEKFSLQYKIFTGPKANTMLRRLDNIAEHGTGWGDMMQYGFFWWVSRPLNWLLNFLHTGLDNLSTSQSWGLAVIALTIIVRTIIWPLHAKSTRSMKRMSQLQPIMKELKAKHPDDPNKLNTEMMGLYRKYGINPIGGCLPMFIQIPIFFGFFRMLDYAVELRNQPFLWVDDLSQPDTIGYLAGLPINLLPIVMAGTSAIQMAMMPKTGDKMQQRIMMFMPLMFFFFCYNYASALALYWTTQNIFSIGQTYFMNKIPVPPLVARKDGGKKTWVQKMADKQAEMQKLQKQRAAGGMRNVTPGTEEPKKKRTPRTGGR